MTNPECIDLIGDTIQEISPKELFDEERVGKLLDDLAAVRKRAVYIGSEEIVRGISVFVNRFIKNRSLCMKALNILCTSGVDRCSKLSSSTIICHTLYLYFICYQNLTHLRQTYLASLKESLMRIWMIMKCANLGVERSVEYSMELIVNNPLKKQIYTFIFVFFFL